MIFYTYEFETIVILVAESLLTDNLDKYSQDVLATLAHGSV